MAEGRSRKRQWPITTLVAATHRYLQSVGRGNPRHRPHCQSHAEEMPRFQDAVPGDPQRTWQRRANPVLIDPLHLAPESTPSGISGSENKLISSCVGKMRPRAQVSTGTARPATSFVSSYVPESFIFS